MLHAQRSFRSRVEERVGCAVLDLGVSGLLLAMAKHGGSRPFFEESAGKESEPSVNCWILTRWTLPRPVTTRSMSDKIFAISKTNTGDVGILSWWRSDLWLAARKCLSCPPAPGLCSRTRWAPFPEAASARCQLRYNVINRVGRDRTVPPRRCRSGLARDDHQDRSDASLCPYAGRQPGRTVAPALCPIRIARFTCRCFSRA